jgi:hypothetical protein
MRLIRQNPDNFELVVDEPGGELQGYDGTTPVVIARLTRAELQTLLDQIDAEFQILGRRKQVVRRGEDRIIPCEGHPV